MIKRTTYLNKLWQYKDLELIKVLTGMRRTGKLTILMQYKEMLLESGVEESHIIYINFESLLNEDILDYKLFHDYILSITTDEQPYYLLLDEIQMMHKFELAINSLNLNSNIDIYITGSNSHILSSELSTYLSGRYIEFNILPFSFKEYVTYMQSNQYEKLLNDYIIYGSLPYSCFIRKNTTNDQDNYIEAIYNTIILKDIEDRENRHLVDSSLPKISNVTLLKDIAKYLSSTIGSPISKAKIANYLTSSGRKTTRNTIDNYINTLEQTYIYYKVERMDISGKSLLKQNYKYYIVDLGFRKYMLSKQKYDFAFSLENIVFFELLRRKYKVNIGKIYNKEIDFIAFKDGVYTYIQVSASLVDESTFNREIAPLKAINDNYEKIILTNDIFTIGNYEGIKVINIIEWLLNE